MKCISQIHEFYFETYSRIVGNHRKTGVNVLDFIPQDYDVGLPIFVT